MFRFATFAALVSLLSGLAGAQSSTNLFVYVANDKADMVGGLEARHFRVVENGKPQEIKALSRGDEKASIAFVFDLSNSVVVSLYNSRMNRIGYYRQGVEEFIESSRKDNQYMFATFGAEPGTIVDASGRDEAIAAVNNDLNFVRPEKAGETRLYDSVNLVLERLSKSENRKRVMILLSDSQDNASAAKSKSAIENLILNGNIMVFTVSLQEPQLAVNQGVSPSISKIELLAKDSGGQNHYPLFGKDTPNMAFGYLSTILRSQYVLTYDSTNQGQQNKKRKVEVRLELARDERKSIGRTMVFHRTGYLPGSSSADGN